MVNFIRTVAALCYAGGIYAWVSLSDDYWLSDYGVIVLIVGVIVGTILLALAEIVDRLEKINTNVKEVNEAYAHIHMDEILELAKTSENMRNKEAEYKGMMKQNAQEEKRRDYKYEQSLLEAKQTAERKLQEPNLSPEEIEHQKSIIRVVDEELAK